MIKGVHTLVYSSKPEALHAPFCATRRATPRIAMSATAGSSSTSPRRSRACTEAIRAARTASRPASVTSPLVATTSWPRLHDLRIAERSSTGT